MDRYETLIDYIQDLITLSECEWSQDHVVLVSEKHYQMLEDKMPNDKGHQVWGVEIRLALSSDRHPQLRQKQPHG